MLTAEEARQKAEKNRIDRKTKERKQAEEEKRAFDKLVAELVPETIEDLRPIVVEEIDDAIELGRTSCVIWTTAPTSYPNEEYRAECAALEKIMEELRTSPNKYRASMRQRDRHDPADVLEHRLVLEIYW